MFCSVRFILLEPVFPVSIPDPEDSDMGYPLAPGGPLAAGGPLDAGGPLAFWAAAS